MCLICLFSYYLGTKSPEWKQKQILDLAEIVLLIPSEIMD